MQTSSRNLGGRLLEVTIGREKMLENVKQANIRNTEDLRDEVVPLLALLETTEGHLGTGDVLLGVLEVGELRNCVSEASSKQLEVGDAKHTRVFSSQVIPACLLASV